MIARKWHAAPCPKCGAAKWQPCQPRAHVVCPDRILAVRSSSRRFTNEHGAAKAAESAAERAEKLAAQRKREGRPTKVRLSRADLKTMQESLERLGLTTLKSYYASPAWEETKRRAHRQGLAEGCYVCGATWYVHVHHRSYARLGHERLTDLVSLCDRCHLDVHDIVQMEADAGVTLWNAHIRLKREGLKVREPEPETFVDMWNAVQTKPVRKTHPATRKYRKARRRY